jgi:hypothetical protein
MEYDEIYRADLVFLKMLLADRAVRTANPHEANLFFLPTFATFHGGNVGWQQGAAGAWAVRRRAAGTSCCWPAAILLCSGASTSSVPSA